MNVLIAYDGSESADTAIDGLRRAGLPSEADALVVSVAEVWLPRRSMRPVSRIRFQARSRWPHGTRKVCVGQRIAEDPD